MAEGANKQVFVIVATRNAEAIGTRIEGLDVPYLAFRDDAWLLVFPGTSRELADKLAIRKGESGSALVLAVANYSGRASSDVWEWFRVNWPQNA